MLGLPAEGTPAGKPTKRKSGRDYKGFAPARERRYKTILFYWAVGDLHPTFPITFAGMSYLGIGFRTTIPPLFI
jgi:hypothetical protein